MAASQGMCCHVLSQPGQSIPGLALQWELGTAWGHRGDLGLMRGTTAGPDSASPLLALPFSCGVWAGIPGRSRAGPMQPWPALPCCCHIDQLNGELMAGTPLGSAAPIRKAELGAPGHCPSGCCKYHFCSSSCGCPAAAAGRVCAAHECVLGSRVCGHSALCVCVCVCWLCNGKQHHLLGTTCHRSPHQAPRLPLMGDLRVLTASLPAGAHAAGAHAASAHAASAHAAGAHTDSAHAAGACSPGECREHFSAGAELSARSSEG